MTLAFSTKSLDWKTRYSFEPVHYATTKNELISFLRVESDSGVYVHDSADTYNTFYGSEFPSKVSVISNEDPSANKIYEAFSVECDKGDWSATFETKTGDKQESSFAAGSLVEREGKHYTDIPKNTLNRSVALSYVGQTTLGELQNAETTGRAKMSGKIFSMPTNLAFMVPKYDLSVEAEINALKALIGDEGVFAYGFIPDEFKESAYVYTFDPEATLRMQEYDSYVIGNESDTPVAWGYEPYTNSLTVGFDSYEFAFIQLSYGITFDNLPFLKYLPISLYSISDVAVNGEDMRGEYMRVDLERSGTDSFELYAINLDQHKTKLDHSLGQNN